MDLKLGAVFIVSAASSVLSGMAGGGASFIITPFYIWLGLTPQQAVATGKFGGFGLSIGAIAAFKDRMLENKRLSVLVMSITTVVGVVATYILKSIDNSKLQLLIGTFMLLMVPFMFFKNRRKKVASTNNMLKAVGLVAMTAVLLAQGVLSSGIGSLTTAIFVLFFGMAPIEANAMKRKTSIILTTVMPIALFTSGLINFKYGFCAMAGGLIGGYIGSRTALRKGDEFARVALIVFMGLSGIWLIYSA